MHPPPIFSGFRDRVWFALETAFRRSRASESSSVRLRLGSRDQPREVTERMSTLLDAAYRKKEKIIADGRNTTAIDRRILRLKRRLRDTDNIRRGSLLCNHRFKLLNPIGSGGFATVWRAYDRDLKSTVAIKLLHNSLTSDRTARDRFFRGARTMASLQHQGIARIIETQLEDKGHYFYVLEYCTHGDLRAAATTRRLPQREKIRILVEASRALHFAHLNGVVHRDIKPANLLLDRNYRCKLTDFDLVWARDTTGGTRTGMLGTVVYSAPEAMLRGADAGPGMDIYSLGVTAVYALQGHEIPLEFIRHGKDWVWQLGVSSAVRDVLARAVEWEPENRWLSIKDFGDALYGAWEEAQSRATPKKGILRSRPHSISHSAVETQTSSKTSAPLSFDETVEIFYTLPAAWRRGCLNRLEENASVSWIRRLDIRADIRALLLRAAERMPGVRWSSLEEFADVLRPLSADLHTRPKVLDEAEDWNVETSEDRSKDILSDWNASAEYLNSEKMEKYYRIPTIWRRRMRRPNKQ